ncbi:MAG: hypothetical protein WCC87_12065 [Candidatus Korobacteraceae bacterium]
MTRIFYGKVDWNCLSRKIQLQDWGRASAGEQLAEKLKQQIPHRLKPVRDDKNK